MPEDFRKVVFDAYEKKKAEGKLSSNLLDPTPGNLREECIIVCRERYTSNDHEILRLFFSNVDKERGYLNVLENSLAEEFKQMSKILRGGVKKPGIKYFDLLAWLIDFYPRTSTAYYKSFYTEPKIEVEDGNVNNTEVKDDTRNLIPEIIVDYIDENNLGTDNKIDTQEEEKPTNIIVGNVAEPQDVNKEPVEIILPPNGYRKWVINGGIIKRKTAVASFIILALVSGGTYMALSKASACMYWTGDHYRSVGCKIKRGDTLVIPLDERKMANFKRITRPDTLTKKDLSKVWYMSIKRDTPDLYTDSGDYPMDTRRRLKPMTEYMLNKYFLRK